MNLRRLLPLSLGNHTRVTAIQCGRCGNWCKPRHIRIPALVCRDCETTDAFQDWKPPTTTPVPARHPRPWLVNSR